MSKEGRIFIFEEILAIIAAFIIIFYNNNNNVNFIIFFLLVKHSHTSPRVNSETFANLKIVIPF